MAKGSVNKVVLLGRLGQDPDVKATASGTQVVNISVATTELGRKDPATGMRGQDETEWHRVVIFGRMAENAATYLRKGSQVYIEGRLKTNKWQDQNGNDRYSTDIICNEMQFISGNQNAGQGGGYAQQPQQGYQQAPQQTMQQPMQNQQSQGGFQQQAPAQPQAQNFNQAPPAQPQSAPQPAQSNGFDDFDDDIPF